MNLRQNYRQRVVHAPAKINLLLDILGKRADGYHDLATLMVPIRLFDSLSFEPTPVEPGQVAPIEFSLRGCERMSDVPADSSNLVVRALAMLRQRSGCELGAKVELVKRIPSAAGLGGGSSDAAAALKIANRAWGLGWDRSKLAALAGELGSDVPFFLEHGAAICRGRGEQVERVTGTIPLDIVIVKPPESLATAEVYRALGQIPVSVRSPADHAEQRLVALVAALRRGTINQIGRWMGNTLQGAATGLSSWIERIRTEFARLDFLGHQLSGSGSAYFGVCRHPQHARRLSAVLTLRQLGQVYVTRSCS